MPAQLYQKKKKKVIFQREMKRTSEGRRHLDIQEGFYVPLQEHGERAKLASMET